MKSSLGEWHDLAPARELAPGQLRMLSVHDIRLCVGQADDGFFALDDTCPHAGGSLADGIIHGEWVICPLHAYAFDRATGACQDDPRCDVRAYETRIQNDHLQVRLEPPETTT